MKKLLIALIFLLPPCVLFPSGSWAVTRAPFSQDFIKYIVSRDQEAGTGKVLLKGSLKGKTRVSGGLPSPVDRSRIKSPRAGVKLLKSSSFPGSYSIDDSFLSPVRDQGAYGDCWAYATFASLESNLLKNGQVSSVDFSEYQMASTHGFDLTVAQGGNFYISTAFLSRWSGPVSEITQTTYGSDILYHQQNVIFLADPDPDDKTHAAFVSDVKSALLKYGPVGVFVYASDGWDDTFSNMYNGSQETPDHVVSIVGWDDTYSKSNFNATPAGNGAFKVRNSWGTSYGKNGYFWLSYYDKTVSYATVFDTPESTSNYKHIYDYSPYGAVDEYVFQNDYVYTANVFTATREDVISAVSFYTDDTNVTSEIYIYTGLTGTRPDSGVSDGVAASTFTANTGYYTVKLASPVSVSKGDRFSVVVKQSLPSAGKINVLVEENCAGYLTAATSSAGQSFYKESDSDSWHDLYGDDNSANFPIKVFTDKIIPDDIDHVYNGSDTVKNTPFTSSSQKLYAVWEALPSGDISGYEYIVSKNAPSETSDVVKSWTETTTNYAEITSTLVHNATYYFGVKATLGDKESKEVTWSPGQLVDLTTPTVAVSGSYVYQGPNAGYNKAYTNSSGKLFASWKAGYDAESGISGYRYIISKSTSELSAGNIINSWTYTGATSAGVTGLSLAEYTTYYFGVKAVNGAGSASEDVKWSDGQFTDWTAPSITYTALSWRNSNSAYGVTFSTVASSLSLYAEDISAEDGTGGSGFNNYEYCVSTNSGDNFIVDWTKTDRQAEFTGDINISGLSLQNGATYYIGIRAADKAGNYGTVWSPGILISLPEIISARAGYSDDTGSEVVYQSTAAKINVSAETKSPLGTVSLDYRLQKYSSGLWTEAVSGTLGSGNEIEYPMKGEEKYRLKLKAYQSIDGILYDDPSEEYTTNSVIIDTEPPVCSMNFSGKTIDGEVNISTSSLICRSLIVDDNHEVRLSSTSVEISLPSSAGTGAVLDMSDGLMYDSDSDLFYFSYPTSLRNEIYYATVTVRAYDKAGNEGCSGAPVRLKLRATGVFADQGGTYIDGTLGTSVYIPADAVSGSSGTVAVVRVSSSVSVSQEIISYADNTSSGNSSSRSTGVFREFRAFVDNGTSTSAYVSGFGEKVTITIPYSEVSDTYDKDRIGIYYLKENGADSRWMYMATTRDKENRTVSAETDHFSVYSLRSWLGGSGSINDVIVYPNPCRMDKASDTGDGPGVKFYGIPAEAEDVRIYIYNAAGELVRVLRGSDPSFSNNQREFWKIFWDGKNGTGEKAASGLYIYRAVTADHGKTHGKFFLAW